MKTARNWIQIFLWLVAIGGGLLAAFQSIDESQENRRWKKANAAKDLVTDIHRDDRASNAVVMLDWNDGKHGYQLKSGVPFSLSYDDILKILSKPRKDCVDEQDQYVHDCFDWFFYYVDRIEHYIRTGLIDFADVGPIFKPYSKKIAARRKVYEDFWMERQYEFVGEFLKRYE